MLAIERVQPFDLLVRQPDQLVPPLALPTSANG
jgi:hypothetical protein